MGSQDWNCSSFLRSTKLEELKLSKDRDQKYYTDQISKLQQEIAKYQRVNNYNYIIIVCEGFWICLPIVAQVKTLTCV